MNRIRIRIGTAPLLPISISLPASKSISHRVLIIQALCGEAFSITHLSDSDDTVLLRDALAHALSRDSFDMDNAGTPFRFLTAFFALTAGERVLTGGERMLQRPIGPLVDALNEMGAHITYMNHDGFPPIHIEGTPLHGGKVSIAADVSSQFVSALLLIAPKLHKGIELHLQHSVASLPYINMTLNVMRHYGIAASWQHDVIRIAPQAYQSKNIIIESDWSASAFWYEIVALAPNAEVTLLGLHQDSMQGDAQVAEIFEKLGVETFYSEQGVHLKKSHTIVDFIEIDFRHIPDMFPAIIATCAVLHVKFRFTGIENLSIKESDRVEAMMSALGLLGYQFHYEKPHTLSFRNEMLPNADTPLILDTHNDHRIAMALAPLCLWHDEITLTDADCVKKSYPHFFKDLTEAGFFVEAI